MNDYKIKIGITQGDINGVGYELIIKSLSDMQMLDFCVPVIYGSAKVLSFYKKNMAAHSFNVHIINDISELNAKRINLVDCIKEELKVEFGQATPQAGNAAYIALERATQDLKNGQIDVLITAPLNADTIPADKNFSGQCQFIESALEEKGQSFQLLVNNALRITAVSKDRQNITKESVLAKLQKLRQCLLQDFSINLPRIAVLKLGEEEESIIGTAIKEAENKDIICVGTYAVDDFFNSGEFGKFDAVLAMTDEQKITALKMLSRGEDICYTAGLSAIITADRQGVNYENAGKNLTSEEAFRQALYLAIDVFRNRKIYEEISANPLQVKKKRNANG